MLRNGLEYEGRFSAIVTYINRPSLLHIREAVRTLRRRLLARRHEIVLPSRIRRPAHLRRTCILQCLLLPAAVLVTHLPLSFYLSKVLVVLGLNLISPKCPLLPSQKISLLTGCGPLRVPIHSKRIIYFSPICLLGPRHLSSPQIPMSHRTASLHPTDLTEITCRASFLNQISVEMGTFGSWNDVGFGEEGRHSGATRRGLPAALIHFEHSRPIQRALESDERSRVETELLGARCVASLLLATAVISPHLDFAGCNRL